MIMHMREHKFFNISISRTLILFRLNLFGLQNRGGIIDEHKFMLGSFYWPKTGRFKIGRFEKWGKSLVRFGCLVLLYLLDILLVSI